MKQKTYLLIIVLLSVALSFSIMRCTSLKDEYTTNVDALTDTISYLHAKNGNLIATKTAFESDIKHLKYLNDSLYEALSELKDKPVSSATHFAGYIEVEKHDTTYIVKHDTISKGFYHPFSFNNKYRILEGNASYANDSLSIAITKDRTLFDYTVALDKHNNIYIQSSNPYVHYNSITGFTMPKSKEKYWYIGPSLTASYDIPNNRPALTAGFSIGYGLIRF